MKSAWIVSATVASFAAAAVLVDARSAWSKEPPLTFEADVDHSYVLFKIKHMGVSWQYGRFNEFTSSVTAGAGGSGIESVTFTVKTESVDTGNKKRDGHLRNPDFFNAKEFPEITFKSTAVKQIDADTSEITGDLAMHGVTKPVTAKVVKVGAGPGMQGAELVGYEATLTVKRSEFEMKTPIGAGSDDVQITVAIEAVRK